MLKNSIFSISFKDANFEEIKPYVEELYLRPSGDLRLILIDREVIGWLDGFKEGDDAWLYKLEVIPKYRNRGLLKYIFSAYILEPPKTRYIFLHLPKERLIPFFKSFGQIIERNPNGIRLEIDYRKLVNIKEIKLESGRIFSRTFLIKTDEIKPFETVDDFIKQWKEENDVYGEILADYDGTLTELAEEDPKTYKKLINEYKNLYLILIKQFNEYNDPFLIYRGIKEIDLERLIEKIDENPDVRGEYWTWEFETAKSFAYRSKVAKKDTENVILFGLVKKKDVDWNFTIIMNTEAEYQIEKEIRLKKNSTVKVIKILNLSGVTLYP